MPGRVRVGSVADFADGKLHAVDAAGTSIVVGLAGDSLCAARNRCPHLGFSLTAGPGGLRYADGQVAHHGDAVAFENAVERQTGGMQARGRCGGRKAAGGFDEHGSGNSRSVVNEGSPDRVKTGLTGSALSRRVPLNGLRRRCYRAPPFATDLIL